MTILSRIVTALLLLLGLVALLLGVKLFNQREEVKGRTQRLEKFAASVSRTLEKEASSNLTDKTTDDNLFKINPDEFKQYYKVSPDGKLAIENGQRVSSGSNTMDGTLKVIEGKAAVQLSRLNDTRDELLLTQNNLASTNKTLGSTVSDLNTATNKIREQDEAITGLNKDIDQKKEQITTLNEEKEKLAAKAEDQQTKITRLEEEKQDIKDKLEADKRFIDKMKKELDACRNPDGVELPPGVQGQVVLVKPEWKFIVLDIPPNSPLIQNVDLIVQRSNQLVGKIRIREVRQDEHFAIAEVNWEQVPIRAGDIVFK